MGGVEGFDGMDPGVQQGADDFAKPITAIGHGEQAAGILRSHCAPTAGDGVGSRAGGERVFELVRNDEHLQLQNDGSLL